MNSVKDKWNPGPISAKQCAVGKSNKYHPSTFILESQVSTNVQLLGKTVYESK